MVADSGYGSEQNYQHLEDGQIEAFVKYNYFHAEQKRNYKNNPFLPVNLFNNSEKDFYICPMGQRLNLVGQGRRKSELGFDYQVSIYKAQNCNGCPLRGKCYKSKGNRTIEVNHNLTRLRQLARKMLTSDVGLYHRSMRPIEPEAVFGQMKSNNRFNRFSLRGLPKVEIEMGLMAIGHNLRKLVARICLSNGTKYRFYLFLIELEIIIEVLGELLSSTKHTIRKFTNCRIEKETVLFGQPLFVCTAKEKGEVYSTSPFHYFKLLFAY